MATVSVETESPYKLKETFSSGTNATGEAGATSVFESLPETTEEYNVTYKAKCEKRKCEHEGDIMLKMRKKGENIIVMFSFINEAPN